VFGPDGEAETAADDRADLFHAHVCIGGRGHSEAVVDEAGETHTSRTRLPTAGTRDEEEVAVVEHWDELLRGDELGFSEEIGHWAESVRVTHAMASAR
jgi:hypothetical protein